MEKAKENPQIIRNKMIKINEKNLPLMCPMPDTALWNMHPRVFIPLSKAGDGFCPYCSTQYKLEKEQ